MEEYLFIYKDAIGNWNGCSNPVFIAEHKCCKAFKKSEVTSMKELLDFMNEQNNDIVR